MKYKAFLSYSHDDEKFGKWLHDELENYSIPKVLYVDYPDLPKNLRPIFRDRYELSSGDDLGIEIPRALKESNALIVICSKKSANSKWVNKEIIEYKSNFGENKIFPIILDGEPFAKESNNHRDEEECFPDALKYKLNNKNELTSEKTNILASNSIKEEDGRELGKLKLISGLLEVKFEKLYRRNEERKKKRLMLWSGIWGLIFVFISVLAIFSVIQKNKAIQERNTANSLRIQAEELIDYMNVELRQILEPLGRTDILSSIENRTSNYFKTIPSSETTKHESLKAMSLLQKGVIDSSRGYNNEAIKSFTKSLDILKKKYKEYPGDFENNYSLQIVYDRLGFAYIQKEKYDEALGFFKLSMMHLDKAISIRNELYLQFDKAIAYEHIGDVYKERVRHAKDIEEIKNDLNQAFEQFDKALELTENLFLVDSSNMSLYLFISNMNRKIGDYHQDIGMLEGNLYVFELAESSYIKSLNIRKKVYEKHKDNIEFKRMLSISYNDISHYYLNRNKFSLSEEKNIERARLGYNESCKLVDELILNDPKNYLWRIDLSKCYANLANIEGALGNRHDEKNYLAKAQAVLIGLLNKGMLSEIDKNFLSSVEGKLKHLK